MAEKAGGTDLNKLGIKPTVPVYPEPQICGECEATFLRRFNPGLRNLGPEVHDKQFFMKTICLL
jgi:hypothetical protein